MQINFLKIYKNKILTVRILVIILAIFLFFNFSGCTFFSNVKSFFIDKFSADEEIEEVTEIVNTFFDLLIDKEYEKAYEYLSSKDRSMGGPEDFSDEFKDVTDIVSIDIKWVDIKSNLAVVGMDITDSYDGEEKVFKDVEVSLLREEEESWKIVFWNQKDYDLESNIKI
ncbi:MAG TPA: hypothetical protein VIH07_03660 [Candidatus Humimicrobiaceae bacterium]